MEVAEDRQLQEEGTTETRWWEKEGYISKGLCAMLQVFRVRVKGNPCKVLKGEWVKCEKWNLHSENFAAAGGLETD